MSRLGISTTEGSGVSLDDLHQLARKRKSDRGEDKRQGKERCSKQAARLKAKAILRAVDTAEETAHADTPPKLNNDLPDGQSKEELPVLTRTQHLSETLVLQQHMPDWVNSHCAVPSDIASHSHALNEFTLPVKVRENLAAIGVDKLFPIQAAVIPELLKSSLGLLLALCGGLAPQDLCVCAPTGCGKTLCYVIPIVSALLVRRRCRLAALVVVPSQELALQVTSVFQQLCKGTRLCVGTTCGLKPLDEEQDLLLDCHHDPITSGVDVLVATPGRLVDHLRATPHFDLRNLRFLVVDEADRLLDQQFHGWLPAVLEATRHSCCNPPIASPWLTSSLPLVLPFLFLPVPPPFPQSHPGSPTAVPLSSSAITTPRQPLQKLLFSASLSLDPEQLSLLSLHQPKLFSVAPVKGEMLGQSTIPTTLIEYAVLCSAELRPLALLHLLVSRGHARSLCFTHSRDTTHRLALLLQQFPKHVLVAELSSDTSPSRRRRAVEDFTSGKIQVLVCSDAMARGMDMPGVECIINYEPPQRFRSYQHRVGRTARAGAQGTAYTLLAEEEEVAFTRMLEEVGRKRLQVLAVGEEEMRPFMSHYPTALQALRDKLQSLTAMNQKYH